MFYNEDPPNPSIKRCILKEIFSNFRTFGWKLSSANLDEEYPPSDSDNEEEVVVSAIRSKAREAKMRRKTNSFKSDSFSRVFSSSPRTGELFATSKQPQEMEDEGGNEEDEDREDYFSVRSYLSRASSLTSREAFLSVKKTNLSRSSSLSGIDFYDFRRPPPIIQELLCHCEGWPFGLCRRALLLPPLPKSPSESWSWRKGATVVKMN